VPQRPFTTPGVKHDSVARIGALGDVGLPTYDRCSPTSSDLPTFRSAPWHSTSPCGGGPGLPRSAVLVGAVRYVAADISPYMLQRSPAGRRAGGGVQDRDRVRSKADVTALQFADAQL